ncbi:hypothetical protein GH714_035490 [Hevea brasiliensis]|uniref:Folylpolyglutamate synthase n=1 Tax=Hevea brasiliensis TaxID=3981 RepID=A0A6A6M347_HEVBR|nr:hypothetical protein GH714_035490 [Hevea brasiliensis]
MEKTKAMAVKDSLQDLPLSNSYGTAMEALSSLITRQKRGTPSSIGGKYGKLDRMQMYLKVDVSIIEVGLGGRKDSTNVIKEPVVCGITPLGMDHTEDNQEGNIPEAFLRGLATAHLSGRAQVVYDSSSNCHSSSALLENSSGDLIFYLDGAHSPESMEVCAKWFSSAVQEIKQLPKLSSSSHDVESMKEVWAMVISKVKEVALTSLTKIEEGIYFSKAIFVPCISTYNKVTSGTSAIPSGISSQDLSWQFSLQRLWEKIIHGIDGDVLLDKSSKLASAETLPPREFLYEDASGCSPADGILACSSVISSLPLTINWLRDCVRETLPLEFRKNPNVYPVLGRKKVAK